MDSFLAQDFKEVLADYADDSIVITPTGTARGINELEAAMGQMAGLFTPENLSQMNVLHQDIHCELASVSWTMGDAIPFGTDTFIIRDGKIQVQSIGMYLPE